MKLVYCVRTDLKMGKGKIAAQVGHATLGSYLKNIKENRNIIEWLSSGEAKIVCKVQSEEEMEILQFKAEKLGLCTYIVTDAGHTQIEPNTNTVLAIGPASNKKLKFLEGLKLL